MWQASSHWSRQKALSWEKNGLMARVSKHSGTKALLLIIPSLSCVPNAHSSPSEILYRKYIEKSIEKVNRTATCNKTTTSILIGRNTNKSDEWTNDSVRNYFVARRSSSFFYRKGLIRVSSLRFFLYKLCLYNVSCMSTFSWDLKHTRAGWVRSSFSYSLFVERNFGASLFRYEIILPDSVFVKLLKSDSLNAFNYHISPPTSFSFYNKNTSVGVCTNLKETQFLLTGGTKRSMKFV